MSYCCEISFKIVAPEDLQTFLQEFKKAVSEHLDEIAADNYIFCPPSKKNFSLENLRTKEVRDQVKEWSLLHVFKYRWFYDGKMLGIFGVPKSVHHIFDCTVYFQNSCDQDYLFEKWNGIPLFEEIARKWQAAADNDVIKAIVENFGDHDDLTNSNLNYYRRSLCYDEIWDHFERYLYQDELVTYLLLFDSWCETNVINKFISSVLQKYTDFLLEVEELKIKKL